MNPRGKAPTPIRSVLRTESALTKLVADGLNALEDRHRSYINAAIRTSFSDSLEIDNNLKEGHDQQNRWDYLLGHSEGAWVVGLEPHSAKDDQVSNVIRKRKAALQQLKPHLKEGAKVAEWFWVAAKRNQFSDTERTRRLLDQNGIRFVCPELAAKHLAGLAKQSASDRRERDR